MSLKKNKCKYCQKPAKMVRMIDNDWSNREYLCGCKECETRSRIKHGLNCRLKIEKQEVS